MYYLGIDVGSVSLAYAVLDQANQILKKGYIFQQGNIRNSLKSVLADINGLAVTQLAFNYGASAFLEKGKVVNDQVAAIEAIKF